jgi:uncharacterized membrane protein YkvA (DUF1232 family)
METDKAQNSFSEDGTVKKESAPEQTSQKDEVTRVTVVRRQPTEEERRQFGREKRRAKEYVNDRQKAAQLIREAIEKAARNKGALQKLWGKLTALFRLAGAWARGEYTGVSMKTIIWVIAAIIYFVNPFDVAPDFIPGVGYVDDAAVIFFVINSIRRDLDKFLEWERTRK